MRYLLDTNILLFISESDYKLDKNVKYILNDYSNSFYVSVVSIFELIHLIQKGRVALQKKFNQNVFDFLKSFEIEIKYLRKEHLQVYSNLELSKDHNDPNDRVIVSQAICEKIPLISSDRKLEIYSKNGLDLIFNKI